MRILYITEYEQEYQAIGCNNKHSFDIHVAKNQIDVNNSNNYYIRILVIIRTLKSLDQKCFCLRKSGDFSTNFMVMTKLCMVRVTSAVPLPLHNHPQCTSIVTIVL